MSAGLSANPDGMRAAAGGFATVGDVVEDLARTLAAAQGAEHRSWGGDEPGATFAQGYEPSSRSAADLLAALAELLASIRETVIANADALEGTDSGNAGHLGGGVGGGLGRIGGGTGGGPTDCWPLPGRPSRPRLEPDWPVPTPDWPLPDPGWDPRDHGFVPRRPGVEIGATTTTDGQAQR